MRTCKFWGAINFGEMPYMRVAGKSPIAHNREKASVKGLASMANAEAPRFYHLWSSELVES